MDAGCGGAEDGCAVTLLEGDAAQRAQRHAEVDRHGLGGETPRPAPLRRGGGEELQRHGVHAEPQPEHREDGRQDDGTAVGRGERAEREDAEDQRGGDRGARAESAQGGPRHDPHEAQADDRLCDQGRHRAGAVVPLGEVQRQHGEQGPDGAAGQRPLGEQGGPGRRVRVRGPGRDGRVSGHGRRAPTRSGARAVPRTPRAVRRRRGRPPAPPARGPRARRRARPGGR